MRVLNFLTLLTLWVAATLLTIFSLLPIILWLVYLAFVMVRWTAKGGGKCSSK